MGLASKLAATSGAPAYPGGPPTAGGPPPPGQQQGGYGGQQQYQAYPGGAQQGRPGAPPGAPGGPASGYPPNQPYSQPQSQLQAPAIPPRLGSAQSPYSPPPQQGYQGPQAPPRPSASPQPYQQPQYQQPQGGQYQQQNNMYNPQYQPYQASHQPSPSPAQYGQQQYGQPQYQQYQQQPMPGYGPPGQQQPSYPGGPPQQQPQYGGAPPPQQATTNVNAYKQLLQTCIQERRLEPFYPPGTPQLDQIAARAAQQVNALAQQWRIHPELASDIVKLALYDVILYVDDSGSMAFDEGGTRIDDLKLILSRVAFAASLFDEDGIQVRFMNSADQGNNIKGQQQVDDLIARTRFSGMTPMGRELNNKIIQPLILRPAQSGQLRKPVLVVTITDGQPTGETKDDVKNLLLGLSRQLASTRYGRGAVAFQFAQVGTDKAANAFLGSLDADPEMGDLIDCTSYFEQEQEEMARANPPVDLTPEMWLMKLLLGSIDSSYDTKDEKTQGRPQGGAPPGAGYGAPGGYGAPPPQQGQYGGYPQQGQYPGQQGPPQGQYGAQQGYGAPPGQPPPGQRPPQQGYGGPPPGQGGYPPQQGGYGAPPPPRY